MSNLNAAQQSAVEYTSGPLLIVAGAGTGKTTVITEKIAYLIASGLAKPEEILALTFTEKAAGELVERVDERLDLGYVDLAISTFHTFCERLLKEYALEIGLPRNFSLLTETDAWLLMRKNIYELGLDYYRPLGNPAKYIHDILRHFSKCKDELITAADYLAHAENLDHDHGDDITLEKSRLTELANAYHAYNTTVLNAGALDFGDLIFYAVQLLRDRPRVLQAVNKRYKYILVDEFQDVNWAQYQLVRLLAGNSLANSDGTQSGNHLTVVGDDDQSIYAFRGASVSNILRFHDDFPLAHSVVLNENYRSKQTILNVAYGIIQNNNPERLEVKLGVNKKLIAHTEHQEKDTPIVQHMHGATVDDEVRSVIEEILSLKEKNSEAVWDDFAILVRANNHAEPFIRGLEAAGIPYEFLSAAGLYRQPIVLDAFSFLKVVYQTRDSVALFRLLSLPSLGLNPHDAQKLLAAAKKKSLSYFEVLVLAPEWGLTREGVTVCARLYGLISTAIQAVREEKPTKILYSFLEASGYLEFLARKENEGDRTIIRQIYQLKQYFDEIARFEETTQDSRVAHFVEYMNTILESGDEGGLYQPTDTPDSVNILSIHGAKGLEFKYVFVVNLVEERFPTRRRGDGIEMPIDLIHERLPEGDYHIQEERRLCYVAATRAKERLYFTSADNYGGVRAKKISRFIIEAGLREPEDKTKKSPKISTINTKNIPQKEFSVRGTFVPSMSGKSSEHMQQNTATVSYELPTAFSFSQIKSYQTCPYQYKLAHILKLPTKSSPHFSFGQSMHATLQDFYTSVQEMNRVKQDSLFALPQVTKPKDGVEVPALEELLTMYKAHWIPDWYESQEQRDKMYALGKDILKKFYAAEDGHWTIPVALESWFKIKIGNYVVHGRIDRIDQAPDGTLHIIDYKTGQSKETLTVDDKEQLLIYQIAAETLPEYRHLGKTGELTFYYLNDTLQTSFVGDPDDLEKIKGKITTTIDQIYDRNFTATPSPFICKYCDFRDICQFRAQ